MNPGNPKNWENATWEGNRKAQLRASLRLTPRQRFEALEELSETSAWLARMGKQVRRPFGTMTKRAKSARQRK